MRERRYQIHIVPRMLHFKQPAGTSRGVYTQRKVWYLAIKDNTLGKWGVGECAPLPDLSCEADDNYEDQLYQSCQEFLRTEQLNTERLKHLPSILFGFETALKQLESATLRLWDTPFSRGEKGIPINGLIWMGDYPTMLARIKAKLEAGYRCIKLKIGAINFEQELALLSLIRQHFSAQQMVLRVDANGAFSPLEVMDKLKQLAAFDLHSIEQPIAAHQWNEMAELCQTSPLPIALDEELIGVNDILHKKELLDTIHPQYIILKPTLHGGLQGTEEWIALAKERKIGYWLTSALESNIGLNAIAQWCAALNLEELQGLGTGQLFVDNIEMPLTIQKDELYYTPETEHQSEWYKVVEECCFTNQVHL